MRLCGCVTVRVYLYGYDIVVGCLYAAVAVCGCVRLCVGCVWGFVAVAAPCACVYMGVWLCDCVAVRVYLYGYVTV